MNKLLTNFLGGYGIELDDLRFDQDAVRTAFKGLLNGFKISSRDSYVISGCEESAGVIGSGYVNIGGEICVVDAQPKPVPALGEVLYWAIEVTYDSNGLETTENGVSINTYEVRKGKLFTAAVEPSGAVLFDDMKTLQYCLLESLGNYEELWKLLFPWRSVKLSTQPNDANDWVYGSKINGGDIRFRILPWGEVQVSGRCTVGGSNIAIGDDIVVFNTQIPNMQYSIDLTGQALLGTASNLFLNNSGGPGANGTKIAAGSTVAANSEIFISLSYYLV